MLRLFLILGVALLAGGVAAVALRDNPGYVLIEIAGYQVETTLAALVLLLVLALVALALGLRVLRGVFVAPRRVASALHERRVNRGREQFEKGLLALRSERWQSAEVALLKYISDAPSPALSYIAAAEAAHHQGARQRRDEYLALASDQDEKVGPAVEMARARWASENADWATGLQALDAAKQIRGHSAQAIQALRLEMLQAAGNWREVSAEMPQSLGALPRPELDAINRRAELELLTEAAGSGELDRLRMRWQSLPKPLRTDAELLRVYATGLGHMGADAEALRLITTHLKHAWDDELVALYGRLHSDDTIAKLATVEQWLNRYGEKPELLLIAGRLCIENRLWGRARSYLEACRKLRPSAQVALELGRLKAQEQDAAGALDAYREGLEMAVSERPQATVPALPADVDHPHRDE